MWNTIPNSVKQKIVAAGKGTWKLGTLDFKPFSSIPGFYSRQAAKLAGGTALYGFGIPAAVGGVKKGINIIGGEGGMVKGGETLNIGTGDVDAQTDKAIAAPTSGVGQGGSETMNAFIDAHNAALQSGSAEFSFSGRTYTVGTVPMQNF